MSDAARDPREETTLDAVLRAAFEPGEASSEDFGPIIDAVRDATAGHAGRGSAPRLAAADAFDRYELGEAIGAGGMGVVYRARDPNLGRDVAIKVLSDTHAADTAFVERFVEEAQIGGQLEHPGIVPVHEVGYRSDGRPYFTMKLVDGATLSELLAVRADPTEDRRRFLSIFERICETVGYAHARGVVHRDLKPHNIMVGKFGEVQIMDWGLAKVLAAATRPRPPVAEGVETVRSTSDAVRSASGSVMGTAAYVPPEQARGEVDAVDARADVFALGAILCEVLTGEPAYVGEAATLWEKARTGDLADAYERIAQASADDELRAIARTALSPARDERPADAGVIAARFHRYRSAQEKRARAASLAASRARMRLAIVVAAAVVLLAVGATLYWREHDRSERARRAATETAIAIDELRDAHLLAVERGDVPTWRAARAAAARARARVATGAVDDESSRRIERLAATVDAGHDAAVRRDAERRRDAEAHDALEQLRLLPRPFDHAVRAARYADVFATYGVGADAQADEQAFAALAGARVRTSLLDGLDAWLSAALRVDPPLAARVGALAQRLDGDDTRIALRQAVLARDGAAASAITRALTPSSTPGAIRLAGFVLGAIGATGPAIERLRDGVDARPDDFWMRAHLVHCLDLEREWDDALAHAAVLRALRPKSPMVWARTGRLLLHQGRIDEAERATARAIALDDTCSTAHAAMASIRAERGDKPGAIAALRRAIEHDRHPASLLCRLGNALAPDDGPAAEAAFERAIDHMPGFVPAWEALARLRLARRDVAGARDAYREVVRAGERLLAGSAIVDDAHRAAGFDARESVAMAWFWLGQFAEREGDAPAAVAAYRASAAKTRSANPCAMLAVLLVQIGRHDEAEVAAREAIDREPSNVRAWGALATSLELRGRFDDALAAYEQVPGRDGGRGRAFLARLVDGCKRKRETLALLRRIDAGEPAPEDRATLARLAAVALDVNRPREAFAFSVAGERLGRGSRAFYERAAMAAARAAVGDGVAAPARRAWRVRAVEWLDRAVARYAEVDWTPSLGVALRYLRHHVAFDAIRDPKALPEAERETCAAVWRRLEAVAAGGRRAERR